MLRSLCVTAALAAVVLTFSATAPAANEPQVPASCPSVTTTAPFAPPGGLPAITINVVRPVLTDVVPDETCDNYPYIPVWADQPTTIPYGSTTRVWYWIEQGHPGGTCYQEGGWGFDRQIALDGSGSYGSSGGPIGTTVGPFNQSGSFTFTVVCPQSAYGPGNQNTVTITVSPPSQPPPPPPPPPPGSNPTVSLTANPNPPEQGGTTTLSWRTTNVAANGCAISSGSPGNGTWSGLPANGSVTTPAFQQVGGYTYSISCRGLNGTNAKASVSFTVAAVWASDFTIGYDEVTYDTSGRVLQSSSSREFAAGTIIGNSDGRPSGCRQISPRYSKHDLFHIYTVWKYVHYFGWCWRNKTITLIGLDDAKFEGESGMDASVNYENNSAGTYYFTWKSQSEGGYYSERHGSISNCFFRFGCIGTSYPWVAITVYGNGTWQARSGDA